eukprot:703212-Pelagomonas_calceolata.AAC.5
MAPVGTSLTPSAANSLVNASAQQSMAIGRFKKTLSPVVVLKGQNQKNCSVAGNGTSLSLRPKTDDAGCNGASRPQAMRIVVGGAGAGHAS